MVSNTARASPGAERRAAESQIFQLGSLSSEYDWINGAMRRSVLGGSRLDVEGLEGEVGHDRPNRWFAPLVRLAKHGERRSSST